MRDYTKIQVCFNVNEFLSQDHVPQALMAKVIACVN